MLFSCALAQIDAIQDGREPTKGIVDAAKTSLGFCCRILEGRIGDSTVHSSRASTSHGHRDGGFHAGHGGLNSPYLVGPYADSLVN